MAKDNSSKNNQKRNLTVLTSVIGLCVFAAIAIFWQQNQASQLSSVRQVASIQNVSIDDLANASGEYLILDVREQWEYDQGHVAGVTLIPLGELSSRVDELP